MYADDYETFHDIHLMYSLCGVGSVKEKTYRYLQV